MRLGLGFGKGGENWEHAQGVDLSSLKNMDTLDRLDNPINTLMRIHDDFHERTDKERGPHPRVRRVDPRDMIVDGRMGLDGCIESTEGHNKLVECDN
jgi:hypothetical protein